MTFWNYQKIKDIYVKFLTAYLLTRYLAHGTSINVNYSRF